MAQHDGRITLETKVDTKGIKESEKDIKRAADRAGAGFKNPGNTISKALREGDAKTAQLASGLQKATAEVEKQKAKVDELKAHLAGLEGGSVKVEDKGVSKLQADFDRTNASIEKTQAEINQLYMQLEQLQMNAFKAPDTGETVLTGKEQAEFDRLNAKLDELEPKLEQNRQKAKELGEALRTAAGAGTQAEIGRTKAKLSEAEMKLQGLQTKAEIAGQKLKTSMVGTNSAVSQVSNGFGKMGLKLTQLARGALVFSAITRGFTELRKVVGTALMSNEGFRQSLYQLQAAFWTAFAPIYNFVLPALRAFINGLTRVIMMIAQFFGMFTGKSASQMIGGGKALKEQADAYEAISSGSKKAAKGMKKTTDEAKKQLAAFDELNILSEDKEKADAGSDSGGGGGISGGADFGGLESFSAEPITRTLQLIMEAAGAALVAIGLILLFTGNIMWGIGFIVVGAAVFGAAASSTNTYDPSPEATRILQTIMEIVGGALVAVGIILLFVGNIPLGIGFILAGAAIFGVAIAEPGNSDDPATNVTTTLAQVMQVVGGALAAVGVILLFLGQILWGVGCIIAGIAALGVSTAELNENGITSKVQTFLEENEALIVGVSLALLVLGVILLFTPASWTIALGLIAAGVVGLASEIAINEGDMKTKVKTFFDDNAALIVGVSLALLVLGIVLVCTGVALPLGIGLIVVGVAGLATEAALNWNYIMDKATTFFQENAGLVVGVSLALIVLGIILLFTGVGIPLALGLIVAGGAALATTVAANWNFIVDKVKEVWGSVKSYWNEHIAKYFTAQWWKDLGRKALNGLIGIVESGLNNLIRKVNVFIGAIGNVVSAIGEKIGLDINIPTIPELHIPRLAQGAVIPPNREFLAVLGDQTSGTNIEAPLATIEQAVENVLAKSGYSGGDRPIILELDGREVGRTFGRAIQDEARRTGSNFVKPKIVFG